MKILGISGSPRNEQTSNTYRLVRHTLEATDMEYEMISLRGKDISGCTACLGCIRDNVCVVDDAMAELREKIVEADAYVIGAPNYFSAINGNTQCFLERWFQFRHQTGNALWGKLAVAIGVGGGTGEPVTDHIERFMGYQFIETVAKVNGQGTASCFSCGYGSTCEVGVPVMLFGKGVEITDEMIPDISKSPATLKEAEEAGQLLAERLQNHDPAMVTEIMQQVMSERFAEGV